MVSCEVEGSIAKVLRRFQRVDMDEMAIDRSESFTRCRTEVESITSDCQACPLLRIVYIRD